MKVNYGTLWDTIRSAIIKWNTVWMNHASVRQFHHHRHIIQGPGRGAVCTTLTYENHIGNPSFHR